MTYTKTLPSLLVILAKSSLGLLFACLAYTAQAQVLCGDFIYSYDGQDDYYPIEDCDDPFAVGAAEAVGDFEYQVAGVPLHQGEERTVTEFPVNIILTTPVSSIYNVKRFELYRHEGDNYRYIDGHAFNEPLPVTLTTLATGTYSIYTSLEQMYGSVQGDQWWKKLFTTLVPIAHAQTVPRSIRSVLTFTVIVPPPEPVGASNVLFIPGIMGSRLYEEGAFCGSDEETEKELWFSTDECKQLRLTTKFTGQSENQIYTKTNETGIFDDAFYFVNIYDSFLDQLADWQDIDLINAYAVFPYDWRIGLDDILKSQYDPTTGRTFSGRETSVTDGLLYKLINQLSKNSKSSKVTIVTHSNGGLVIKQLLRYLSESDDPLLEKIDVVVLVAVPQLGSPDATVGILHGVEIDRVMEQDVTRRLMNTMAFSHHLLPTQGYFNLVSTPHIAIEPGVVTDVWQTEFGQTITNRADLHAFLSSESGRSQPTLTDLATPEVVDPLLLQYARTTEVMQEDFIPPPNVRFYQVAGTGLETPSQLTYFTDRECVSRTFFTCTNYAPKLGYRVMMTVDGDATVPVPSALALAEGENVERRWVNLYEYNNAGFLGSSNSNRLHKDIFEVSEVSDYIKDIILNEEVDYRYISDTTPVLDVGERLVFQLHSPLDLRVETVIGRVVSSSTNEVSGAIYRRYGELQYLSVPRTEDLEVILDGIADGSFTLDIEEVDGGGVINRVTLSGVPNSAETTVRLGVRAEDNLSELILMLDYDGDGEVDARYDESGLISEDVVTYADLYDAINTAELKRGSRTVLLALAKTAEHFAKKVVTKPKYAVREVQALNMLIKQSILLERKKKLTTAGQGKIQEVTQILIDN